MQEFVSVFPTSYFIIILFIYYLNNYINYSKKEIVWMLFSLYCGWSLFLGLRNVYDDVNLDPYTFHEQAKNLSIGELWNDNFPKIDILLQLIMKFYFTVLGDDTLVLILTQATIISLIFTGVLYFTDFSPNALLLTLSFLVFTNTGILLTANFLRQGLAIAIFINLLHLITSLLKKNRQKKLNYYKLLYTFPVVITQFFAHMSSIYLLICLVLAESFNIRRLSNPSFLVSFLLLLTLSISLGQSLLSITNEIYSGYEGAFYDEGIVKLYFKISIDVIALFLVIMLKRSFGKKIENENIKFNLLLKICIFILISCIIYSSVPVIALRIEYYLNFLIIIALASLVSSEYLEQRIVRITMFGAIILMYVYSFAVYDHPSVTRVLVF